jgi:hypothetical protein
MRQAQLFQQSEDFFICFLHRAILQCQDLAQGSWAGRRRMMRERMSTAFSVAMVIHRRQGSKRGSTPGQSVLLTAQHIAHCVYLLFSRIE